MVGAAGSPILTAPLLQERGGNNSFTHEALTLKYKLDNQFELVFVVSDSTPQAPLQWQEGPSKPPTWPQTRRKGIAPEKRGNSSHCAEV